MKRIEALKIVLENLKDELVIVTTGMSSREAFAARDREENFYMVGSMGLVTPLSLGVALNCDKKVIAIEGDGSLLMNLGSLAMVGVEIPANLITIVLDNGTYESTGGQKCPSQNISFNEIAQAVGFRNIMSCADESTLKKQIEELLKKDGPSFLHIKIESSHEEGTPRVSLSPQQLKERFMKALTS